MKQCPDRLYKYLPLSAYSLASPLNGTSWFARPSSFNDPYDCALTIFESRPFDYSSLAYIGLYERPEQQTFDAYKQHVASTMENIGICCLSEKSDHMLLWSHYSQHHRGFCIEYDSSEGTDLRATACEVNYSDTYPIITMEDMKEENAATALWTTKATCWEYEKEWRLLNEKGNVSIRVGQATSVIFGARMPEADRLMLGVALRHSPEVELKQAIIRSNEFKIDIVPYSPASIS